MYFYFCNLMLIVGVVFAVKRKNQFDAALKYTDSQQLMCSNTHTHAKKDEFQDKHTKKVFHKVYNFIQAKIRT